VEEIVGSNGADILTATSTPSSDADDRVALDGSAGPDTLNGGTTGDLLVGGPGNDVLNGGGAAGQDGSGTDGAGAAGDNVHADVEEIDGSAGDDTLGDAAANVLFGFSGNDVVTGGGGSDFLVAGDGNDILQATDSTADLVRCGSGVDAASIDDIDTASDCESTNVTMTTTPMVQPSAQVRGPVVDTTPAKVTLNGPEKTIGRLLLLKRGVKFTLVATEAVNYEVELTGATETAHVARVGDLILASKTLRSSGNRTTPGPEWASSEPPSQVAVRPSSAKSSTSISAALRCGLSSSPETRRWRESRRARRSARDRPQRAPPAPRGALAAAGPRQVAVGDTV